MNWEAVTGISSVIVALAALVFSFLSFRSQQERADKYARASVKPLLSIKTQGFVDLKSIQVRNSGLGPAIVKKAEFRRASNDEPTTKVVELFKLNVRSWEFFVNLPPGRVIPAGDEMVLIKQSLGHLMAQGYGENEGLRLLEEWKRQKRGILIHIEYEDIYGIEMKPLDEELS